LQILDVFNVIIAKIQKLKYPDSAMCLIRWTDSTKLVVYSKKTNFIAEIVAQESTDLPLGCADFD